MTTTEQQVLALGARWADAEQREDIAALDALSADDFTLVGPVGFILDKQQWLDRYRTGELTMKELTWDEVRVRDYGDAAVAIGRYTQRAQFQGKPVDATLRCTQILVRDGGEWKLAGIHLSPLGGPPPFAQQH